MVGVSDKLSCVQLVVITPPVLLLGVAVKVVVCPGKSEVSDDALNPIVGTRRTVNKAAADTTGRVQVLLDAIQR